MRVFVSWSGPQAQAFAEFLQTWLRRVIQELNPFMSARSIEKGTRWSKEIAQQLEGTNYGLVCVTRENLSAPWVNFEAGALAKATGSRVSPLLLDVAKTEVTGPLADLQLTAASDKEDVRQLLADINKLASSPLPDDLLQITFEREWEAFESKLSDVVKMGSKHAKPSVRRPDEILAELLDRVRTMERSGEDQAFLIRRIAQTVVGADELVFRAPGLSNESKSSIVAGSERTRMLKEMKQLAGRMVVANTRDATIAGQLTSVVSTGSSFEIKIDTGEESYEIDQRSLRHIRAMTDEEAAQLSTERSGNVAK